MSRRFTQNFANLICAICVICGLSSASRAQDEKFPLPYEAPKPTMVGDYVATGSIDFGWRFTALSGSEIGYRSIVDIPSGPTLGFSRIELRSPENTGRVFDDLLVEGTGIGGEPTSSFRTRVAKRGIYVVDYRHSRFQTYNFVPDFANPLFFDGSLVAPHGWDRERQLDSLDVTVFQEHHVEGHFGFFRTAQSGLALGTDVSSDTLVFDRNLDNGGQDYRGGVTLRWPTWLVTVEQRIGVFDDLETDSADPTVVTDPDTLANFSRRRTARTTTPSSRVTLTANPYKTVNLTARAVYIDYDVTGGLFETLDAVGSDVATSNIAGVDGGSAFLFDSSQDWRVLDRVRLTNNIRYRRYTTVGRSAGLYTTNGDFASAVQENDERGYRDARFADEVAVQVDVFRDVLVRAGYRFAHLNTDFSRTDSIVLPPPIAEFSSVRTLERLDHQNYNAFLASISYRLRHDARFFLEYENGREPNPNYVFDEGAVLGSAPGDYQLLRVRGSYAPYEWLQLSGSVRTTNQSFLSGVIPGRLVGVDDPFNPVFTRLFDGGPPLETSRSRGASLTVRLAPNPRASFGVTYDGVLNTASITYLLAVETPPDQNGETRLVPEYRFISYVDRESLLTADFSVEPVDRMTVTGFYSLVGTSGSLGQHYHQADLRAAYRIGRGVSGVVEWRLYDYVNDTVRVTDFTANHTTVGVRWEW